MPKYMFTASYTQEGVKGLLEVGGSSRKAALESLAESVGGNVEALYYAFGDADLYVIAELPDDASAASLSLRVAASGAGTVKTTVLLDVSTIDEAVNRSVSYTPPGE